MEIYSTRSLLETGKGSDHVRDLHEKTIDYNDTDKYLLTPCRYNDL
jgi:hypothetical protein